MIRVLLGALFLCLLLGPARARDGWQGRPSVCGSIANDAKRALCQQWVATVKQPDSGTVCCGDGDFYYADRFDVDPKTGQVWAIINDGYSDIKGGTRVPVPPNKRNDASKDGNPTGHGVIAMRGSDDPEVPPYVFCWFQPSGV